MADGDLEAVLKGVAEDAAQAGHDMGEAMAKLTEDTASKEEEAVARTLAADEETARAATAIGKDNQPPPPTSPGTGGAGGGISNRVRPPRDGDQNYVVDNPNDPSDTITDIDRVEGGTLWEEKTATGQDPRIDIPGWVQRNVVRKLDSYLRARQYLPGYENAPFGLDFTQPGATPEFRAAVEDAVRQWMAAHPGVPVTVRWAS